MGQPPGGTLGYGTIFSITTSGVFNVLYNFDGATGGPNMIGGLTQHTNGTIYGTGYGGGSYGWGTVYSLNVGLGPFVKFVLGSGKVGSTVQILGQNLTGTTAITFNGAAAAFTVVSDTLITTTVPAGATTGKVQVVTASGTLSSNVPFRVLP